MAIPKELMNRMIEELDRANFVYHYLVTDNDGNEKEHIRAYRTHDNNEDYILDTNKTKLTILLANGDRTNITGNLGEEVLKNIQIKNLAYEEKRIIHNVAYPKVHALSEQLMKEVLDVFANCQHLTQALTSKIIKDNDENILSYLNMNLNVQYRIYLDKKGLAVILNSQDVVCPDEKEVKKLLNLIRINEYEYHKKLEEFNLKAKDEITYHDMQLKAVI